MAGDGAVITDLRQLNGASARVAEFAVKVCHPKVVSYSYSQNGQKKVSEYFVCRLVSGMEHDYIEGCVRGSQDQVQAAGRLSE